LLITRQSVKIVIIEKRIINIKYRKRSSEMSKNIRTEAVDHLFEAILCLKDKEECYTFFEDVCTINELLSLSQRFEVAKMLMDKRTYLDISEKTGASTATISRVNRSLNYGNDGYDMVFKRMEEKKEQKAAEKREQKEQKKKLREKRREERKQKWEERKNRKQEP